MKKFQMKNKVAGRQFYFRYIHSFGRYYNDTVFYSEYTYHRLVLKGDPVKEIVISTERLTKTFSWKELIKECSISVEQGTIYGLLGKNGAGKTTIFKLLLGFLKPTAGTSSILGMDSVKDNIKILKHTGNLIETPVFYEHLSATENLLLHLSYMGVENVETESVLTRVGLPNSGIQPVQEFSLGMRQRLAIARAVIHKPKVLILDEPFNGLDPVGMKEIGTLFCQLTDQEGMTILMSSHLLSEVQRIANRIGVIADGKLVLEKNTDEIRRNHLNNMADLFCGAALLFFHYFMAAIPLIDPSDPDIAMFSSYGFLFHLNHLLSMAVFGILSAGMGTRFVIEEYHSARAILIFSYPVR